MAVYTKLCPQDVAFICQNYGLSQPASIEAIAQGMENSNYFLYDNSGSDWVVTIFEELSPEQVNFFLHTITTTGCS